VLTISNPRARNALAPGIYPAAIAALREVAADAGVGAIVLTGEGEHFCGGGNLNRLRAQRELPPDGQIANLNALHDWVMAMRECPKPVIAAVEGAAAGGGFSVCLGCDLIVAAEDAKFVMSYVKVGLSPDGGGSDSLAVALPPQAALELLLDGAPVTAARLHALGVVNRVVPRGRAAAEALGWAERLAQGPAQAQARIKRLMYAARGHDRRAQLDAERDAFIDGLYHDECGEGIAAFLDKRAPKFVR
jgi:enoyl-CoA hydratase/carnithine racemase